MRVVNFALTGRFAHFGRAESGTTVLSYPIPPRTVIMGLVGAILGISKDAPQVLFNNIRVAISGKLPPSHWHKAKFRKDPPELLPPMIRRTQKLDKITKPELATLITQEWLLNPRYLVWVSLPEPYQSQFEWRLRKRQWHFQPSLGLTEMLADIEYINSSDNSDECLVEGFYHIDSVVPQDFGKLDFAGLYTENLAVQMIRMPRSLDSKRVFIHAPYVMEREGKPLPVNTSCAFQIGDKVVMFL